MGLWQCFLSNDQRLVDKWNTYFPVYERHFTRFVDRPALLMEIGVAHGGSLQLWKRYFGPHVRIVGIDIDPRCKKVEEDQIFVRIGDQSDHGFLQSVVDEFGAPDIVIDDGSHRQDHVNASFRFLYPEVKPDGLYLVEDLHTAYSRDYLGGRQRRGSFIETTKYLIDELNAGFGYGTPEPNAFSQSTLSIHVYPSIVVFERGRAAQPRAILTGEIAIDLPVPRRP